MEAESLIELFAPIGVVSVKRMFGGKGVYLDGLIVAVELSSGELFLKGDEVCAGAYEAAGARRWRYEGETKAGAQKRVAMPYWSMPEAAFDDEAELSRFARMALDASIRADAAKAAKPKTAAKRGKAPSKRKDVAAR